MHTASPGDPIKDAALEFLQAYWDADLPRALAACAPGAIASLPPSAPFPTPSPIETVLPKIFSQVYTRFVGGFEITVDRCLTCGATAIVEYTGKGKLTTGDRFLCQYLAVLEIEQGRVARWKPYMDTKYVAEKLL
jgi:hypothetical protein